jgi:hypothetical protein
MTDVTTTYIIGNVLPPGADTCLIQMLNSMFSPLSENTSQFHIDLLNEVAELTAKRVNDLQIKNDVNGADALAVVISSLSLYVMQITDMRTRGLEETFRVISECNPEFIEAGRKDGCSDLQIATRFVQLNGGQLLLKPVG